MERALMKYIESELYHYDETLKLINEIREEIACDQAISYDKDKLAPSYKISHPTEDKAIELISNIQLRRALNTIKAIDRAKKRMTEDEVRLYEYKYQQQIHNKRIYTVLLKMSERSFYNMRNRVVIIVAEEMGFTVNHLQKVCSFRG